MRVGPLFKAFNFNFKSILNQFSFNLSIKSVKINPICFPIRNMSTQIEGYGSWKSPITSEIVAKGGIKFSGDIAVDLEGRVYWIEVRAHESGRSVICSKKPGDSIEQWTPENFNARSCANEYGGGAFFVSSNAVYFSNFKDQRLYRQNKPDSVPEAITPDSSKMFLYADGQFSESLKKIFSVKENHTQVKLGNEKESQNTIVCLDPETKIETVLVSGADFYSSPRVSPNGKHLAWCEWNHPNMPWDTTSIWKADLNETGTELLKDSLKKVAGVANNSVILPYWSPSNELYFIDDRSNWWNLYRHDSKTNGSVNVIPKQTEIGGPLWIFGKDGYAFSQGGLIYASYSDEVVVYDTKTSKSTSLSIGDGLSANCVIASSIDGSIYLLAGGPTTAEKLIRIQPENNTIEVIKETLSIDLDAGYLAIPEKISFPTTDNGTAHAYLYLPKNKDYSAPDDQLPPLMVRVHGGPTSAADSNLNLKHQYLTSRGFAVLDVNYRGSTGYGRAYRDSLKLNWGIYDVDDVCAGATHLVKSNKVNGQRLCIDGGSAGGYTVLAALTFKSVFNAGISNYGVSDLEALVLDTHKFESRYLDYMVGAYPETKTTYMERSPIHHTEQLSTPMAFFQGGEDKVVPPAQAEEMFEVVKKKGLTTAYVLFPEEQHGFRAAKNIQKAIDGELYFLSKVFGFKVPDLSVEMEIVNL